MFFTLSKLAWLVVSPLNLMALFMLAGAGMMMVPRLRRFAGGVFTGAFIILLLTGVSPLGKNMLAGLENMYQRPAQMPPRVTGILVLGGAFETGLSEARRVLVMNDGAERVVEGLALARRYPDAQLVFSGGEGLLAQDSHPESQDVQDYLAMIGHNGTKPVFESRSRNTYENAIFSRDMIKPGRNDVWILVTSAYHMKRSMALMAAAAWPGAVIPWPVDYRTDGTISWAPHTIYIPGNIYDMNLAAHEYLGLLAYRLTGKL